MGRERDERGTSGAAAAARSGSREDAGSGAVELSAELQTEIREFARALPRMSYYEILGVPRDAAPDAIRGAFFECSKRFHPDRYFRKELGVYAELLNEIFKRVAVAHDVLREPALRAQYDKSPGEPGPARPAAGSQGGPAAAAGPRQRGPQPGSLRARRGLRPPDFGLRALTRQLELAREKAAREFETAVTHRERREWARAAEALRLCVALDPRESRYQDALSGVVLRANEQRAARALADAEGLLGRRHPAEALERLQEAVELRPLDHDLAHRAAELSLEVRGDVREALRYARRAVELDGAQLHYRKLLGRLLKSAGEQTAAREQFEKALAVAPGDAELQAELRALGHQVRTP